jgi:hypothetical protein
LISRRNMVQMNCPRFARTQDDVRRTASGIVHRGGIGQHGTITRVWARRGSRPRAKNDRRFTWANLFGAACPERGVGAAVVMPDVNIEAMNEHLAVISRAVTPSAIAVVVLDGTGGHASPRLKLTDNIVLLPLPPYAPELNGAENIWELRWTPTVGQESGRLKRESHRVSSAPPDRGEA